LEADVVDEMDETGTSEPGPAEIANLSPGELRKLLTDWLVRTMAAQYGHQTKADSNRIWGISLGIPTVIISTVVGTAAFAAINDQSGDSAKIAVGVVSVVAAVMASIQTYLGYSQLAERHRVAAVRYAALRRDIELAIASGASDQVTKIRQEMDKIGAVGPQIGARVWESSLKRAKREVRASSGVVRVGEAEDEPVEALPGSQPG